MAGKPESDQIGELLRRASHALRTPLAIVLLELGMLEDERARRLEGDLQVYGESVRRAFLYLRCVSGDIGEHTAMDLSQLTNAVVDRYGAAAGERNIALEFSAPRPVWRDGYPNLLTEGLQCIVENAIRHTPQDGRIKVTCDVDNMRIIIEDSGPGYPPAALAGEFEPFEIVSGEGLEVGIGLPLAALVASLNGGRLSLANGANEGGGRAIVDFGPA